jgi:hypothetical protein
MTLTTRKMKKKIKGFMVVVACILILVMVCVLILAIPGAKEKVADVIGWPLSKLTNTLVTIIGTGVGLTLISFGVASIAIPVVGIPLIVIGLALTVYSLWNSGWFTNSTSGVSINSSSLNKVA